jgi:class 3 adenylate cyclase
MTQQWLLWVAVVAIVATLAVLFLRSRREATRLRARFESASRELQTLQQSFSRFAPAQVVERVIARGVSTSGERREVTVLFADLVAFTGLSDRLEPEVLVRVLNGYFARVSRAVSEHRGHVAKFIGDGVLALFGALEPNPWQAADAVEAALAIRGEVENYNRELAANGLPSLRVSVGVHRGDAVSGLVGSRDLMEFTVLGRTVNIAARVEGTTRKHAADIVITAAVATTIDDRFELEPLGPQQLRGVSEPVTTFAVITQRPLE